jgi:hypothetical protein
MMAAVHLVMVAPAVHGHRPFESVLPVEPVAPLKLSPPTLPPEPPEPCATAQEKLPRSRLRISSNGGSSLVWKSIIPKFA